MIRLTNEGTGQLIVFSLIATSHSTRKLCQLGQLASSSWETSKSFFLQNSLLLPSNSQAFHQYSPPKLPPAIQELLVPRQILSRLQSIFSAWHTQRNSHPFFRASFLPNDIRSPAHLTFVLRIAYDSSPPSPNLLLGIRFYYTFIANIAPLLLRL